uniref:uncharacterized protein LOC113474194 n=1 Tax=Ciona intestinalis TaxID=7719 RepID=UPI000EF4EEC9|nr:uncharacterized protein LOC113474194 [Ciona intestinalis]|eukprot:XP_026690099.1 uncharacterized protein LOC113474194 [Ciona intestinalis]
MAFQNDYNPDGWKDIAEAANVSKNEFDHIIQSYFLPKFPTKSNNIFADVAIGILETIVNGETLNDRREGLKSVVGFSMLSLLATGFGLIQSAVLFHKLLSTTGPCSTNPNDQESNCIKKGCKLCFEKTECTKNKLRELAFSNYSSGCSAGTALAVFGFSAGDSDKGSQYGHSFYLLASSIGLAAIVKLLTGRLEGLIVDNTDGQNINNPGAQNINNPISFNHQNQEIQIHNAPQDHAEVCNRSTTIHSSQN